MIMHLRWNNVKLIRASVCQKHLEDVIVNTLMLSYSYRAWEVFLVCNLSCRVLSKIADIVNSAIVDRNRPKGYSAWIKH